jgi:hypothetical protein
MIAHRLPWAGPCLAWMSLATCSWCPGAESRAAGLDPEIDKPYQLRVVLGMGDHRLLTSVFQDQVERELGESLQAALGDLAIVEVTRQHPRLKEVQRDGLQALDAWKDVDGVKTHFVLIDYVNGEYEVQARQHDGLTGQSSDVVRRVRLADADRPLVPRIAALLVGDDFGIVGTVTGKLDPTNNTVPVTLKGSKLGEALDRRIKPDDVLALVQITAASGGMRATRVLDAVLRVQRGPDNGVCVCQYFHRFLDPASLLQEGRGILGYRCVKLSTGKSPLRLRLVKANPPGTPGNRPPAPFAAQRIDIRRQGFTGEELTKVEGATSSDGYFSTEDRGDRGLFDQVAFVTVISGKTPLANMPVPVFTDGRTVTIVLQGGTEAAAQLSFRRDLWVGQTYQSLRALVDLFNQVGTLLKERKRDEALSRAQAGLAGVQEDITRFMQQREQLVQDAGGEQKVKLGSGDEAIKQLRVLQGKLQDVIARLDKVVKEEKDPKRLELQEKVSQARLLEGQAEFGKALELYEEVLQVVGNDPELSKKVEKLKEEWRPKSEKHQLARDFIYKTWPTLDPLRLLDHLKQAQDAFQTCVQVGDTLGPQKLLAATADHAAKLQEKLASLNTDASDDDRATAETIAKVSEQLKGFLKQVSTYLDSKANAEK